MASFRKRNASTSCGAPSATASSSAALRSETGRGKRARRRLRGPHRLSARQGLGLRQPRRARQLGQSERPQFPHGTPKRACCCTGRTTSPTLPVVAGTTGWAAAHRTILQTRPAPSRAGASARQRPSVAGRPGRPLAALQRGSCATLRSRSAGYSRRDGLNWHPRRMIKRPAAAPRGGHGGRPSSRPQGGAAICPGRRENVLFRPSQALETPGYRVGNNGSAFSVPTRREHFSARPGRRPEGILCRHRQGTHSASGRPCAAPMPTHLRRRSTAAMPARHAASASRRGGRARDARGRRQRRRGARRDRGEDRGPGRTAFGPDDPEQPAKAAGAIEAGLQATGSARIAAPGWNRPVRHDDRREGVADNDRVRWDDRHCRCRGSRRLRSSCRRRARRVTPARLLAAASDDIHSTPGPSHARARGLPATIDRPVSGGAAGSVVNDVQIGVGGHIHARSSPG